MAFKMKGNPMKRNFGIGSATKQAGWSKSKMMDAYGTTDQEDIDMLTGGQAKDEVVVDDSATPQDKFANLANIDLNPKTGMGGKQGTHTMEGLE